MCSKPYEGSMGKNFDSAEITLQKMEKGLANLETHYGNHLFSLDEFQKLNFEEKLIRIRSMYLEFSESLTRLREDHKLLSEREGRIAERYAKLDMDHLKMISEKNSVISELKENINQMGIQMEKRDVDVEACQQKIKEKNDIIEATWQKIKEKNEIIEECQQQIIEKNQIIEACHKEIKVKSDIFEACQQMIKSRNATIEEMKLQQLQFQGTIEELKRSNSEDLRCKNLESNKVAAIQHLNSRTMRVEEMLSSLLNIKMDDLKNVGALVPSVENGEVTFLGSKGKDDGDVIQLYLSKIAGGETNNTTESSPLAGAESRCVSSQSYGRDEYPIRGSKRLRGPVLLKHAHVLGESIDDSLDNKNTMEIIDDDDGDDCPSLHRRGMISEKTVRGGDECTTFSSISLSRKKKRSSEVVDGYHTPISRDKEKQIEDSTDEDLEYESCSESCINALIERCRSEKLRRTWMFGTDMKKAFLEDDDLCLNAVCVLYRQQILPSEPRRDFYHFHEMSGKSLAEYLIDGEQCLKLRKSAAEVKQERPDVIDKCRKLALAYCEHLFSIYCTRKDPYFN